MWHGGYSMASTSRTSGEHRAGCSKRLSSKAAASEEARRTLRYVELLSEARTKLADFFSILLDRSFPGRRKRVVVDQFLVCGEIIGFNGEVVLIERLRASRGTEVRTI